jgi:hypothetical protein
MRHLPTDEDKDATDEEEKEHLGNARVVAKLALRRHGMSSLNVVRSVARWAE